MSALFQWSNVLNFDLVLRNRDLVRFMMMLVILHAMCFTLENTARPVFTVIGEGAEVPQVVTQQEPNNWAVQINKLRVNNIEKLLYLGTSIGVFVVGANLGFQAADFKTMYRELNLLFMVYIVSLVINLWANWICAQQPQDALNSNGAPPLDVNGEYQSFNTGGIIVLPLLKKPSKNQGIVSAQRLPVLFWIAQWLLIITTLIQTVLLSYLNFGLVGAYTTAYPFGLLARALKL
jgi:hypothetical protein